MCNESVFSFLRTLTTRHSRIRAPLMQQSIDISYTRRAHSSKRVAAGEWNKQTGGQTDRHCTVS